MERAISEMDGEDLLHDVTNSDSNSIEPNNYITISYQLYDDHWSKHRAVTGLDWSAIYPELLLASYHINEESLNEPEGVCLIWNTKFPKKRSPEFIFHCQSPITSTTLSDFHPNLVMAGTYSGQIVLWDSRVNKRTPVQKSPLNSFSHSHPVFAITMIGTQNAHSIISLDSDAYLCVWSLDMLVQPREKIRVCNFPSSTTHYDVNPTCMSFFANDMNNYALGAENGNAYCDQRHSSQTGLPDERSNCLTFQSHSASITSISTHPSEGPVNLSPLFLTSSLDWTIKLWSNREQKPLHTFDDYQDYVYDACWSPTHPAVFAAVDGTGRLDVWNINKDVEVPSARCIIGRDNIALNKCRWNKTGTLLAAGDDYGQVTICNVPESLSQPSSEEWSIFVHNLAELKHGI